MEKKDYIDNIIQACDKVLEHYWLLYTIGGNIEELYWEHIPPETMKDKLEKHTDELDKMDKALQQLRSVLKVTSLSFGDLASLIRTASLGVYNLRYNVGYIKKMSLGGVLAIRSIMGQVKLLRDTLIWANNGD